MRKKIMCIFMCMLMIFSAMTTILYSNNVKVEASGGGDNGGVGSDYDFMWNVTKKLSNVIYEAYDGNDIRKGRSFGSIGEQYAADYIHDNIMTEQLNLEDVHREKLGDIDVKPLWNYSWKVEALDYQLTINNASNIPYPYPRNVPKNETFVWPSGAVNTLRGTTPYFSPSYRRDYTNMKLVSMDLADDWFLSGGQFTNYFYNVTCTEPTTFSLVFGNATYIPTNQNLPSDQEGRFFIMDEEEGCEYKLDNVTNASGVLLVYNETKGFTANTSGYSFQIARAQQDESNLTTIIDMLQNGTWMLADNVKDTNTVTFTYNFQYARDWWPEYNFSILCQLPSVSQGGIITLGNCIGMPGSYGVLIP